MDDRGFYLSHHRHNCWLAYAGSNDNIYIGVRLMPNSTAQQRMGIEKGLIDRLDPVCNIE